MGRVIAVLNQKGGVGKTTIAAHIGHAAALQGMKVLLVDSDPQGSLRDWHAARVQHDLELIAADTTASLAAIPAVAASFDLVVIDGMPRASMNAAAALRIAQSVLIPVQPSAIDLWATNELVDAVKQRQMLSGRSPAAWLLMSRVLKGTIVGREMASKLEHFGFGVLESKTHQRVIYANAMAEGRTVLEAEPSGPAAHEIRAILREVSGAW